MSRSFWITYIALTLLIVIALQSHYFWLTTKIIPFEKNIDLTSASGKETFLIDSFADGNYVLYLVLNKKFDQYIEIKGEIKPNKSLIQNQIMRMISVSLRDKNRELFIHPNKLGETREHWRADIVEGETRVPIGVFEAKLFEEYFLTFEHQGIPVPTGIETKLIFFGLDDGYLGIFHHIFSLLTLFISFMAWAVIYALTCKKNA